MKNEKLKKKILLDLRLIVIAIPSYIVGFLCSPFVEKKFFDVHPFLSGVCGGYVLFIIIYLIISWMFYDYFYRK